MILKHGVMSVREPNSCKSNTYECFNVPRTNIKEDALCAWKFQNFETADPIIQTDPDEVMVWETRLLKEVSYLWWFIFF